jgi:hypothetical protein
VKPLINPYLDLFEVLSRTDPSIRAEARKKLIWAYSWAVPSAEAIQAIARLGPVVELGAGTGYWAWLLEQAGTRVRAIDSEPTAPPHWHPVEEGGVESLADATEPTLLLCWPTLDSAFASEALRKFRGSRVAYVGEWMGRTASREFHVELERRWTRESEVAIPVWPGFTDRLHVFRREERPHA